MIFQSQNLYSNKGLEWPPSNLSCYLILNCSTLFKESSFALECKTISFSSEHVPHLIILLFILDSRPEKFQSRNRPPEISFKGLMLLSIHVLLHFLMNKVPRIFIDFLCSCFYASHSIQKKFDLLFKKSVKNMITANLNWT